MKRILFILLFGFAAIPMLFAGPVRVSFKDTTMVRGSTVYIPVRVDSSLTGLNVFSYELDISYTTSGALIDTAVATGSMTSGWLPPVYHLSPGRITISSAGTSALTGTGFLLFIRVKLPLSGTAGATSLTLNKAMFNEGTPATALRSGTIIITNPPSIDVNPNTALLTVGDTQQFSVSGATPPITWSSTSPSIGSINASGLLSGLSAGFCRVVAVDVNGTRDTNQQVEIRACRLSVRDTTYRQGQTFLLPVYISSLSAVDIFSGTFTLSYNANILTATGASHTGTLLGPSGAPTIDINSGSITVAFASAARLNGVGQQVLVYIQFLVTSVNTYGTSLTFSNILLNESLPANNVNAGFSPISTSSLTVSPNTATLVAGDSLQFSVSGGAVNPVIWSVSNPSLATISATGMLKALASGTIQVSAVDANTNTGKSGTITLYDIRLQLPTISSAAGFIVDQTFNISGFPPGIYSAQFQVNFNSTYFTPISVSTGGTLASSWMMALDTPSPGIASIAGAGSQPITSAGSLLRLRFQIANNVPAGNYAISLTNTLLNEGKPLALITNGSISISPTAVTQSLLTGWNMVSIPLNMTDMLKTTLYPTATTKAYSYNGTYLMPDTLQNRIGYWLKFSSPLSKQLAGSPRSRDTISVRANGWNMIGSVAYPIPKTAIVYNPPANTISAYYTYVPGSGYQLRDTIKPGVGYWIKTLNAGNLILDLANVPPAIVEKSETSPNTLNELKISQLLATGEESEPSRLYFGEHPAPADRMEEFDLPPLPPPGCFDVRFASNRYVAHLSAEKRELPILLQTEGNGIKIAWSIVGAPGVPYVLVEKKDGKVVAERELSSDGSMWIGDPEGVTLSLTIRRRPAEFSLSQNYPNPFNPVTVIRYNLPARQDNILSYNVSLRIYNMLGQLVATVVDEAQSPGSKTVTFDAGNLASGMYIYKISAGTFSATRKMVLLK